MYTLKSFLRAFLFFLLSGELWITLVSLVIFFPVYKSHLSGFGPSGFLAMSMFQLVLALVYGVWFMGMRRMLLPYASERLLRHLVIIPSLIVLVGLTYGLLSITGIMDLLLRDYREVLIQYPTASIMLEIQDLIGLVVIVSFVAYLIIGTRLTIYLLKRESA